VGVGLRIDDLPPPWRRPAAVLGYVALLLLAGGGGTLGLVALARAEAREETRRVVAADLDAYKREALAAAERAAREGADRAVRETVTPILVELRSHVSRDDDRQDRTDDAIRELREERRTRR
jgi:hypothetical protein